MDAKTLENIETKNEKGELVEKRVEGKKVDKKLENEGIDLEADINIAKKELSEDKKKELEKVKEIKLLQMAKIEYQYYLNGLSKFQNEINHQLNSLRRLRRLQMDDVIALILEIIKKEQKE